MQSYSWEREPIYNENTQDELLRPYDYKCDDIEFNHWFLTDGLLLFQSHY